MNKDLREIRKAKAILIGHISKVHEADMPLLNAINWLREEDRHIRFHGTTDVFDEQVRRNKLNEN